MCKRLSIIPLTFKTSWSQKKIITDHFNTILITQRKLLSTFCRARVLSRGTRNSIWLKNIASHRNARKKASQLSLTYFKASYLILITTTKTTTTTTARPFRKDSQSHFGQSSAIHHNLLVILGELSPGAEGERNPKLLLMILSCFCSAKLSRSPMDGSENGQNPNHPFGQLDFFSKGLHFADSENESDDEDGDSGYSWNCIEAWLQGFQH